MDSPYSPVSLDDMVKSSTALAPYALRALQADASAEVKAAQDIARQSMEATRQALAQAKADEAVQKGWRDLGMEFAKEGAQWDNDRIRDYTNYMNQAAAITEKMASLKLKANEGLTSADKEYLAGLGVLGTNLLSSFPNFGDVKPDSQLGQQQLLGYLEQVPFLKNYISKDQRYLAAAQEMMTAALGIEDEKAKKAAVDSVLTRLQAAVNPNYNTIDKEMADLEQQRQLNIQLARERANYKPDLVQQYFNYMRQLTGGAYGGDADSGGGGAQQPQSRNMLHLGTADGKDLYINPAAYGGYLQGDQIQVTPTHYASPEDMAAINAFNEAKSRDLKLKDAVVTLGAYGQQGLEARGVSPAAQAGTGNISAPAEGDTIAGEPKTAAGLGLEALTGILLKEHGRPDDLRRQVIKEGMDRGPQGSAELIMRIAVSIGKTLGQDPRSVAPYVMTQLGLTEQDLAGQAAETK